MFYAKYYDKKYKNIIKKFNIKDTYPKKNLLIDLNSVIYNILSDTSQYMANYYSTINSKDEKYCVPVKTVPKKKPEGYNKNQLPITDQPYFDNPFDIQPLDEDYTDYIIPVQYYNDINLFFIYVFFRNLLSYFHNLNFLILIF
mgnify:CR=1 FL=1